LSLAIEVESGHVTYCANAVFRLVSHRQTFYINAYTSLYKVCDYARGFDRGALLLWNSELAVSGATRVLGRVLPAPRKYWMRQRLIEATNTQVSVDGTNGLQLFYHERSHRCVPPRW
jgi:hypothetical protein